MSFRDVIEHRDIFDDEDADLVEEAVLLAAMFKRSAELIMTPAWVKAWIAKREKATGRTNPMVTYADRWAKGAPFATSQEAYDTLHIGDVGAAQRLQTRKK